MSAQLSPLFDWRTAIADSDLSSSAKLLALVLSLYMNKQGSAFPSRETLAKDMSSSPATVKRARFELVKEGWLNFEQGGGARSNRYTAVVPGGQIDPAHSEPGLTEYPPPVSNLSQELDYELEREPTETTSPPAQHLVAYFVDRSRDLGSDPPRRIIGQVAKEIGGLLGEGFALGTVEAAIELLLERGLHPSALASCVHQAQLPAPKRRGGLRDELVLEAQQLLAAERAGDDGG